MWIDKSVYSCRLNQRRSSKMFPFKPVYVRNQQRKFGMLTSLITTGDAVFLWYTFFSTFSSTSLSSKDSAVSASPFSCWHTRFQLYFIVSIISFPSKLLNSCSSYVRECSTKHVHVHVILGHYSSILDKMFTKLTATIHGTIHVDFHDFLSTFLYTHPV